MAATSSSIKTPAFEKIEAATCPALLKRRSYTKWSSLNHFLPCGSISKGRGVHFAEPRHVRSSPHLNHPPRPVLPQPPLHELVQLLHLRHPNIDDPHDLIRAQRHASRLLHDAQLALRVERDGERARRERLLQPARIQDRRRVGFGEISESEAKGGVMEGEGDGGTLRRGMLKTRQTMRSASDERVSRRTIVTSSPMTSTSGLRKCFRAVIPARQAQSSMFPASARKCTVSLKCHT